MSSLIDFVIAYAFFCGVFGLLAFGGLKVWVIYNCPSHPHYRGRPR